MRLINEAYEFISRLIFSIKNVQYAILTSILNALYYPHLIIKLAKL